MIEKYNQELVNELEAGSYRLNEMKAKVGWILGTLAHFVSREAFERYGKFREVLMVVPSYRSGEPGCVLVFHTNKRDLSITLYKLTSRDQRGEPIAFLLERGDVSGVGRKYVLPLYRTMPIVIKEIGVLFPSVLPELEFFLKVPQL